MNEDTKEKWAALGRAAADVAEDVARSFADFISGFTNKKENK